MNRCEWAKTPLMISYHDREWGVPVHNDRKIFEFLVLEGAQAGLSWETVLKKRENYRRALNNFDYFRVSKYTERDVLRLLKDEGIIRNRLKISAAINNAQCFIEVQKEFGSFDRYIWGFVNNRPIKNMFLSLKEIPSRTELSDKISKDLKKRGFSFVGSTIIYAHMQATGMVNDHVVTCHRWKEV